MSLGQETARAPPLTGLTDPRAERLIQLFRIWIRIWKCLRRQDNKHRFHTEYRNRGVKR